MPMTLFGALGDEVVGSRPEPFHQLVGIAHAKYYSGSADSPQARDEPDAEGPLQRDLGNRAPCPDKRDIAAEGGAHAQTSPPTPIDEPDAGNFARLDNRVDEPAESDPHAVLRHGHKRCRQPQCDPEHPEEQEAEQHSKNQEPAALSVPVAFQHHDAADRDSHRSNGDQNL